MSPFPAICATRFQILKSLEPTYGGPIPHRLSVVHLQSSRMGVELSVDPPTCPISAAGGVSKHKIINHTDQMLAFKVKSTNNSNYSVSITFGLIQIGYTEDLIITRIKGKPQADRLVIQYASVAQDCRDPKAPFATGKPVGEIAGETQVKLSAAE